MLKKIFSTAIFTMALLVPNASQPNGIPSLNTYLVKESQFIGSCQATFTTAVYLANQSAKYIEEYGVEISDEDAAKLLLYGEIMASNLSKFTNYFAEKYPKEAHLSFSDVMALNRIKTAAYKEQLNRYAHIIESDARPNEEKANIEYAFSVSLAAKGCVAWFNEPRKRI